MPCSRPVFLRISDLEQDGDVLVVVVQERPAIAEISFEGNKDLETDKLKAGLKEIGLPEGRVFKRALLERVEQELNRQILLPWQVRSED